jgi:hypothetical protein
MLVPSITDQPNGLWSDSSYRKDSPSMDKSSVSRKGRGTSALQPQRILVRTVPDAGEEGTLSTKQGGEEGVGGFSSDLPPPMPVRKRESLSRTYGKETNKKMSVLQEHLQQFTITTPDVMGGSPLESRRALRSTEPNQDGAMPGNAKVEAAGRMTSRGTPERGIQRSFSNSGGKKSARGREKFLLTNDVEDRRPASRSRSKSRVRRQRRLNTSTTAAADASLPCPDDQSSGSSPRQQLRRSHTIASEYGIHELQWPRNTVDPASLKVLVSPTRGMKKGTRKQILEASMGLVPAISRSVSTPSPSHCDDSRSSHSQSYAGRNEKFGHIPPQEKSTSRRNERFPILTPGEINIADWHSDDDEES